MGHKAVIRVEVAGINVAADPLGDVLQGMFQQLLHPLPADFFLAQPSDEFRVFLLDFLDAPPALSVHGFEF
jgi:hypothetical protein